MLIQKFKIKWKKNFGGGGDVKVSKILSTLANGIYNVSN